MKRHVAILGVVAILGIVVFGAYRNAGVTEYTAPQVVEREVEVLVTEKEEDKRVQEAQSAARKEVEEKAQRAYDDVVELEMNKIKASVLKEIETEVRQRRLETEQEIGAY